MNASSNCAAKAEYNTARAKAETRRAILGIVQLAGGQRIIAVDKAAIYDILVRTIRDLDMVYTEVPVSAVKNAVAALHHKEELEIGRSYDKDGNRIAYLITTR